MLTLDSLEIEAKTVKQFKEKHLQLERELEDRVDYFVQKYIEKDVATTFVNHSSEPSTIEAADFESASYPKQLLYLTIRSFLHSYRMLSVIYLKFLVQIMIVITVVLILGNMLDDCSQPSFQNRLGMAFTVLLVFYVGTIIHTVLLFPDELSVFINEQNRGMYSPLMYLISKILGELPFLVASQIVFSLIMYYGMGLNQESARRYFIFVSYSIIF